jgi:hypothetical protein
MKNKPCPVHALGYGKTADAFFQDHIQRSRSGCIDYRREELSLGEVSIGCRHSEECVQISDLATRRNYRFGVLDHSVGGGLKIVGKISRHLPSLGGGTAVQNDDGSYRILDDDRAPVFSGPA